MKVPFFLWCLLCFSTVSIGQKMRYVSKEEQPLFFDYANPYSLVSLIHTNREVVPILAKENNFDGVHHAPNLKQLNMDTSLFSKFTIWTFFYYARPEFNDSILLIKPPGRSLDQYLDSIKDIPGMELLSQIERSKFERIWGNVSEFQALKTPYEFYFDTEHIVGLIVAEDEKEEKWYHFVSEIAGKRLIGLSLRAQQLFKDGNFLFYEKVDNLQAECVTTFFREDAQLKYETTQENQPNGYNYCRFGETLFSDCSRGSEYNLNAFHTIQYSSSNKTRLQFGAIDTNGFTFLTKTQVKGDPISFYDFEYGDLRPYIKSKNDWNYFLDSTDFLFDLSIELYDTTGIYNQFMNTPVQDTLRWPVKKDLFWAEHPQNEIYVLLGLKWKKNKISHFVNQYYFTVKSENGPKAYMSFEGSCYFHMEDPVSIDIPEIEQKLTEQFQALYKIKPKKTSFLTIQKESQLIHSSLSI